VEAYHHQRQPKIVPTTNKMAKISLVRRRLRGSLGLADCCCATAGLAAVDSGKRGAFVSTCDCPADFFVLFDDSEFAIVWGSFSVVARIQKSILTPEFWMFEYLCSIRIYRLYAPDLTFGVIFSRLKRPQLLHQLLLLPALLSWSHHHRCSD